MLGDLGVIKFKVKIFKGLKKGVSLLVFKKLIKEEFKLFYVWLNFIFLFRLYYDGFNCRIFIIENI